MEELPSSAGVLEGLLRYNGFRYRADGARFHLVFRDRGCKWETAFVCLEDAVLIYGRYPFPTADRTRALQLCEKVNREVLYGGMFLGEGHLIYRTCADLYDAYLSYEQLGRALEYNAGVIRRYWEEARACAEGERAEGGTWGFVSREHGTEKEAKNGNDRKEGGSLGSGRRS